MLQCRDWRAKGRSQAGHQFDVDPYKKFSQVQIISWRRFLCIHLSYKTIILNLHMQTWLFTPDTCRDYKYNIHKCNIN